MKPATSKNPWLKMALNNAWANATLYTVLGGLSADAFAAPRPGFFPSLAQTMNHIYQVDLFYLDALEKGGLGPAAYDREPEADPRALGALQSEADMRFAAFCRDITPAQLGGRVVTRRRNSSCSENVAALVLHLVQHQVHHRGQAHVQLSYAGIAPPQLDDFYLEYGRTPSAAAYW